MHLLVPLYSHLFIQQPYLPFVAISFPLWMALWYKQAIFFLLFRFLFCVHHIFMTILFKAHQQTYPFVQLMVQRREEKNMKLFSPWTDNTIKQSGISNEGKRAINGSKEGKK